MTPVQLAASQGDIDILNYLVHECKADLDKKGDDLNLFGSPMHMACLTKQSEVLEYLLDDDLLEGYDPVAVIAGKTNYGALNVFHICAKQNAVQCFKILKQFLHERLPNSI